MFDEKALKTMKADALSILENPTLVAELEENERRRKREKGNLEDRMVFKSGEEKAVEMEIEVAMEDRPYGGATTLKEAKIYIKDLERAQEFGEGMNLFEGIVDNILNSDLALTEKEKRLSALLEEARKIIAEGKIIGKSQKEESKMGFVSIRSATSLSGAMRNLVDSSAGKNYKVSLGVVVRALTKNILNLPAGAREKAYAQLKQDLQPHIQTEGMKKGSVRWLAMISSGLDPTTGRPIEEHEPTLKEIVEQGTSSIAKAIERSAARQRRANEKPKKEMSSIRRAALRNSGLDPDTGEILF